MMVPFLAPGPAAAAPLQRPAPASPSATADVPREFEAQVLGALLLPMFETLGAPGAFGGGPGEAQWRPMLVAEFGKAIARAGGLGLADAVIAAVRGTQEAGGT
jgi:flagellar protein FlgJ